MISFLKNRFHRAQDHPAGLGTLESRVMEILWARGESTVRDVCEQIESPRAYTTVMTTLERLFKKGLLARQKSGRAFLYKPAVTRQEWQRNRADNLLGVFLNSPEPSRNLLLSTLLDAVGEHDETLLDELERQIQARRKELSTRGKS